jgi:hypothetical protein
MTFSTGAKLETSQGSRIFAAAVPSSVVVKSLIRKVRIPAEGARPIYGFAVFRPLTFSVL